MARRPRLQPKGQPVHAVIRGNDRQAIFHTEGDRAFMHRCLVEVAGRMPVRIHAYVFMTNHVHLLATPDEDLAVGRYVQAVGRRYVSYFNSLHKRTGTLWEGRYRGSPVTTDRYVLACYQYIEMNPVRAGMVGSPLAHPWSSHRANMGLVADDLVTPHPTFEGLSADPALRPQAYAALFATPLDEALLAHLRDCLHHGWAFGDEAGCAELGRETGQPTRRRKRGPKPQLTDLDSDPN